MCLSQAQNAAPIAPPPMTLPGSSSPSPNGVPGGDTGPNSLGAALDASRTPQAASVKVPTNMGRALELATGGMYDPTGGVDTGQAPMSPSGGMQPTKFGALLKILQPMMEGATVGGFMGKSNPGGGFGAAQNMFVQRRMHQLQMAQLMQQIQLQQSTIAKNQAEAQWAERRPMVTRTAPVIKGKDDQGNDIFMEQDPQDGRFKPVNGIRPNAQSKEVNTNEGMVTYDPDNPKAGALPLTLGPQVGSPAAAKANPAEGSDESASEPSERAAGNRVPTRFDSGSPSLPMRGAVSTAPSASPGAISSNVIPHRLYGPGFNTPKATVRASRNAAGVETDNVFDTNPNSPTFGQRIAATGNTRQPAPDRVGGRENTRDAQKAADTEDTESYAATALQKSGGDPDKALQLVNNLKMADPEQAKKLNRLLPQIRKSITDRAKQRKPRAKATNPLGISDADWQKMTGGQPAPGNDNEEQ